MMPSWRVRVEAEPEPRYAFPETERSEPGVVEPMPTLPELLMMKFVAVDEPTTNWFEAVPATGLMAKVAKGVEVPTPTLPAVLMKSVEVPASAFVPVKYATWPRVPV